MDGWIAVRVTEWQEHLMHAVPSNAILDRLPHRMHGVKRRIRSQSPATVGCVNF